MTIIEQKLKAPFPYFGGKSRIAHEVWARFGDVPNYVEPFAGSLAVLLARPTPPRIETVNDIDCFLTNFWRALRNDPDGVATWADYPVSEIDLHARHRWLVEKKDFIEAMRSDPYYYDVQIAGWWVWGICAWIGGGWCRNSQHKRPCLGDAGLGRVDLILCPVLHWGQVGHDHVGAARQAHVGGHRVPADLRQAVLVFGDDHAPGVAESRLVVLVRQEAGDIAQHQAPETADRGVGAETGQQLHQLRGCTRMQAQAVGDGEFTFKHRR